MQEEEKKPFPGSGYRRPLPRLSEEADAHTKKEGCDREVVGIDSLLFVSVDVNARMDLKGRGVGEEEEEGGRKKKKKKPQLQFWEMG